MEFNTQNSTKSKQIGWNSNDQGGQRQFRSYTCTFCKRGFSNAQALGGHMNIHRRDRAKLKQSYEENLLSLDISIKNTRNYSWEEEEEVASNHKMPFTTFPAGNDNGFASQWGKVIGAAELAHLPSIVGRLSAEGDEKDDLDLELKLGPADPQKAPTLGMREFF